MGIVNILLL